MLGHSTAFIETSYDLTLRAGRTLMERFRRYIMVLTRNLHMFQGIFEPKVENKKIQSLDKTV